MAEELSLPGWPKKKLVKEVRSYLAHYGIRPIKSTIWQATWNWAHKIASSYWHLTWPLPTEIASQYVVLLLAQMHGNRHLRLPHRAKENLPPEVAVMLPALQDCGLPAIELAEPWARRPRKSPAKSRDSPQPDLFPNP